MTPHNGGRQRGGRTQDWSGEPAFIALPARGVRLALRLVKRLGVGRHGPEQVDFLLHRPVLDNTRLRRDFPGMPRKTTHEAYEMFRQGRAGSRG